MSNALVLPALLVLIVTVPSLLSAKPSFDTVAPQEITVEARPLVFDREHPKETKFGALTWIGGVELRSSARPFGGFSGLVLDESGTQLLAVSDAGLWLKGRLAYDGDRVSGLNEARMGSLLDAKGEALRGIKETDAESMTGLGPDRVLVAFERDHRLGVYPVSNGGFGRPLSFTPLPPALRKAKSNSGVEALAILKGGPLRGARVLFTESLRDSDGNVRGWIADGPAPGSIALKRLDDFAVTDLAALGNGDLLVLERHFSFATGIRMRIRRIAAEAIHPNAVLDGDILIEAGPALTIDNMEAMAVHENARGQTVITLLSDDNYNAFERTLLLQFRLGR